eukprot:Lankesteria_metandrocarpae@DN2130_c0_g1_i2.p1
MCVCYTNYIEEGKTGRYSSINSDPSVKERILMPLKNGLSEIRRSATFPPALSAALSTSASEDGGSDYAASNDGTDYDQQFWTPKGGLEGDLSGGSRGKSDVDKDRVSLKLEVSTYPPVGFGNATNVDCKFGNMSKWRVGSLENPWQPLRLAKRDTVPHNRWGRTMRSSNRAGGLRGMLSSNSLSGRNDSIRQRGASSMLGNERHDDSVDKSNMCALNNADTVESASEVDQQKQNAFEPTHGSKVSGSDDYCGDLLNTLADGEDLLTRCSSIKPDILGECSPESTEFLMTYLTDGENFRVKYLKRLSYANVWVPMSKRPPLHQTVIIFDWDDTLLCTSFINKMSSSSVSSRWVAFEGPSGSDAHTRAKNKISTCERQLKLIEAHALKLLKSALKMGRVFIITNAAEGWVEFSSAKYLPLLGPVLEKITIISARERFEPSFPGDYHRWKIHAFLEVQQSLNNQIITNLISLGDSTMEMEAVLVMGKECARALVKTIKFRERPTPFELAKQLEIVEQKFGKICNNARNLKIGLERQYLPKKTRDSVTPSDLEPPVCVGTATGIE